jgi:hypothetical protein
LIEAKGRAENDGSFQVSPHENEILHDPKSYEKYYFYAVKNALSEPEVNVIEGWKIDSNLLQIFIKEAQWKKIRSDRILIADIISKDKQQ